MTSKTRLTKAVFPVAGLGTRFLPATKANPKEMLPIVDKPLIQFAVEEAIAAGINELIFVTSSSKRAIEDHFDSNFELEAKLAQLNKTELLEMVRNILPRGVSCAYIRQPEALGLGHAVWCAKPLIDDQPFAVLLADDLIDQPGGCLAELVKAFNETNASVLAIETVAAQDVNKYGIIAANNKKNDLYAVDAIVEKPKLTEAPSNLAVVGRYILTPRIFHFLEHAQRGSGNEIQLTDAIAQLLKDEPVYGLQFAGQRYDCGSKLGYLQATIAYALRHGEVGEEFKQYLQKSFSAELAI